MAIQNVIAFVEHKHGAVRRVSLEEKAAGHFAACHLAPRETVAA